MWRSATRSAFSALAVEDLSSLWPTHKRLLGPNSAQQQSDCPSTRLDAAAEPFRVSEHLLVTPLHQAARQQDVQTTSAVQQAYAEWSRPQQQQQQPTTPTPPKQHPSPFWGHQEIELLQSLLQDVPPLQEPQQPAAAAAAAATATTAVAEPCVSNSSLPHDTAVMPDQAQGEQASPAWWGLAPATDTTTSAGPSCMAWDGIQDCPAWVGPCVLDLPQHTRTLLAPAALPADPAQLQSQEPAAAGTATATANGGPPGYTSPFAQQPMISLPGSTQQASQPEHQHEQLHAPALLEGWSLLLHQPQKAATSTGHFCTTGPQTTASSRQQLSPEAAAPAPPLLASAAAPAEASSPAGSTWLLQDRAATAVHCSSTPTASCGGTISNAEHRSPFLLVEPWELNPISGPAATAGLPAGIADAVLLQAYRLATQQQQEAAGRVAFGSNNSNSKGGVRKRQAKGQHSSTVKRLLVMKLEQEAESLKTKYAAEAALNGLLQQRWARVSAEYDALTATRQQQQQQLETVGCGAGADTGAAAAAAGGGPIPTTVGADCYDDAAMDALAAVVHNTWTNTLFQLADLLPQLAQQDSDNSNQQQQQQQPLAVDDDPSPFAAFADEPIPDPVYAVDSLTGAGAGGAAEAAGSPVCAGSSSSSSSASGANARTAAAAAAAAGEELAEQSPAHGKTDVVDLCSNKRPRATRGAGSRSTAGINTDELSLLLTTSLSLQSAGPAKQPRLHSCSNAFTLTDSDLHMLFSAPSSRQQQQQALQDVRGAAAAQGSIEVVASAATVAATSLYGSLWSLFEQVGLAGPALLYRCFGPQQATCSCCLNGQRDVLGNCSGAAAALGFVDGTAGNVLQQQQQHQGPGPDHTGRQTAAHGMVALLLDSAASAVCPPDSAPAAAGAQRVPASAAHWQRVASSLSLTSSQQSSLHKLWSGVQAAHHTSASKRQQLVAALQHQAALTGGGGYCLLPVVAHRSCQLGTAAAAVTDQLLVDIDNSLALDYGVVLEMSKKLWGDESPLTLVQKAKCLVASHPFWPDYGLLAYLADSNMPLSPSHQ